MLVVCIGDGLARGQGRNMAGEIDGRLVIDEHRHNHVHVWHVAGYVRNSGVDVLVVSVRDGLVRGQKRKVTQKTDVIHSMHVVHTMCQCSTLPASITHLHVPLLVCMRAAHHLVPVVHDKEHLAIQPRVNKRERVAAAVIEREDGEVISAVGSVEERVLMSHLIQDLDPHLG